MTVPSFRALSRGKEERKGNQILCAGKKAGVERVTEIVGRKIANGGWG